MEYILIMLTTMVIGLLKNTNGIELFIKRHYWVLSLLIFPTLLYFSVIKDFSVGRLIALTIIIGGSLYKYTTFFKKSAIKQ